MAAKLIGSGLTAQSPMNELCRQYKQMSRVESEAGATGVVAEAYIQLLQKI